MSVRKQGDKKYWRAWRKDQAQREEGSCDQKRPNIQVRGMKTYRFGENVTSHYAVGREENHMRWGI